MSTKQQKRAKWIEERVLSFLKKHPKIPHETSVIQANICVSGPKSIARALNRLVKSHPEIYLHVHKRDRGYVKIISATYNPKETPEILPGAKEIAARMRREKEERKSFAEAMSGPMITVTLEDGKTPVPLTIARARTLYDQLHRLFWKA